MRPQLLTIEQAAESLGVPKGSLLSAARRHGLLVKMGRASRIEEQSLRELIEKCRESAREPASNGGGTEASTTSGTARDDVQRALATAERLKRSSPATSRNATGRNTGQVHPIK